MKPSRNRFCSGSKSPAGFVPASDPASDMKIAVSLASPDTRVCLFCVQGFKNCAKPLHGKNFLISSR
jgi:hypothetical protein